LEVKPRRLDRLKERFCCELIDAEKRHDAVVMNLSSDGLFVLTKAPIPTGTQIEIQVSQAQEVPEMTLRAIVVRQRLVPDKSSQLKLQGLGMQILQAPSAYYELVEREKEG
jgi:hypothetical protein